METEGRIGSGAIRFATWGVLLVMVLFAMTSNIVFASLSRVSMDFDVPSELFSATVSVQFSGFFVTCLLLGILSDRFGKRIILTGACVLAALGALGWCISPQLRGPVSGIFGMFGYEGSKETIAVVSVSLGALLMGAAGGVLESVGSAILTDLHPDKSKLYMNLSQAAYCVGAITPTYLMGWLYPLGVSWKVFFVGTAVCSLLLAAYCFCMKLPKNSQAKAGHGNFRSTMRILPSVAVPCISNFCYVFPEMASATFLGIYLKNFLNAPESMSIYCLPMFWSAVIVGRLACAFLPQKQKYEYIIAALMFAAGLFTVFQPFVTSWQMSMVLFVLTGLAFSGTWPLIVSLASSRNLEDSGTAAGVTISVGSLGCIFNPIILGPLFHGGHVYAVFFILSGLLVFGSLTMLVSGLWRNKEDNKC